MFDEHDDVSLTLSGSSNTDHTNNNCPLEVVVHSLLVLLVFTCFIFP